MVTLHEVLEDLRAESEDLDRVVSGLSDVDWSRPTPAAGWSVAHQIAHLAWTDHAVTLSATDPAGFVALVSGAAADPDRFVDTAAAEGIAPPQELLRRWRDGREELAETLVAVPPDHRLPWFFTSMSALSSATGRLMETWAHGQDVADTFGITRRPTGRLRHVAHLGYRTIGHSFAAHGLAVPAEPFRVELSTTDGAMWTFGPVGATDRVAGPVLDFCLLVTQRRHPAGLALHTTGEQARRWLGVAQAFAGPPGVGREP
jgi:uncharacterized protein (TIGR03084 family)